MIDFSNVKSIVVPEGEVAMISRGGEILWQKQMEKGLRYIKFVVNEVRNAGTQMQLSELDFLDAAGNRYNWPATTTVTSPDMPATSVLEGASKIIDSLTSTKFCTVQFASGGYLLIDLGEKDRLDVQEFCNWQWWTANDNAARDPVSFELWGSEDGDAYELLDYAVEANVPSTRQAVAYAGVLPKPRYKAELEYLESTGAQYIDAGFIPNQDTRVLTEHSYTKQPANRGFIYGAGISATSRAFEMYTWGNNWNSPYGNANMTLTPRDSSLFVSGKITIDKNKEKVTIQYADGTSQTNIAQYATFDAPRNMWLFAINRGNTSVDLRADCVRLYCCKIWNNGTLVRDFIPVLDWDNLPCMYDRVTDELFYNQGTGEFLCG